MLIVEIKDFEFVLYGLPPWVGFAAFQKNRKDLEKSMIP